MKKILCILFLLASMLAFGSGEQENATLEITFLGGGGDCVENAVTAFIAEHPYVGVKYIAEKAPDGTPISLDSLLAAGTPPDIYMGYIGRSGKVVDPNYALPLNEALADIDDFMPEVLAQVTKGGKLLAAPFIAWAIGFEINTDITDRAGWQYPGPGWTTDDFMVMAQKVDVFPSAVFAANPSGDYIAMSWFAAFGAKMFDGDYSRTTINSEQGRATMRFLADLHKRGYIPAEAGQMIDDDYIDMWINEEFAAGGSHPGWEVIYQDRIKAGGKDHRNNYKFVGYPRAPGVNHVPVYLGYDALVAHDSGDAIRNAVLGDLIHYITLNTHQVQVDTNGGLSTRRSTNASADPKWRVSTKLVADNGVWDAGLCLTKFAKIRCQMPERLQAMFAGKESPDEALAAYEAAVNSILEE